MMPLMREVAAYECHHHSPLFFLQYVMHFPFLAVFTVYSWRVVFAYYRVLACNGGVELDSDASGYGADALNGGNGQGCNSIDI